MLHDSGPRPDDSPLSQWQAACPLCENVFYGPGPTECIARVVDHAVDRHAPDRRSKYALRYLHGTHRTLMEQNGDGVWKDIATFDSYNDAQRVLGTLRDEEQRR